MPPGSSHPLKVYLDFLGTSLRAGVEVLAQLGQRRYSATRSAQYFIRYDETALRQLTVHRHDTSAYISNAQELIRLLLRTAFGQRPGKHPQPA